MSFVVVKHIMRTGKPATLCGIEVSAPRPPRAPEDQTYTCLACDARASTTRLEIVHEARTPLNAVKWESVA